MKVYMSYTHDLRFNGFYAEDIHGSNIPEPYITIDNELWKYLQNISEDFKIKEAIALKELYTIEDKEIIEIIPFEHEDSNPSGIGFLEEQNANLIKELLRKDIEIKDLQKDVGNLILQTLGGK